jgi:hypothetical protein
MKQCFCGCGRTVTRFPLGLRSINTRGRLVRERLDWAKDCHNEPDSPWAQQGETILLQLQAAVHGEIDPAQINPLEPEVREWQRYGRALERDARDSCAPSLHQWLAQNRSEDASTRPSPTGQYLSKSPRRHRTSRT